MPIKFGGKSLAVAVAVVGCLVYGSLFVWPRHADFSYAVATCRGELSLLPGVDRTEGSAKFSLTHSGGWSLGGFKMVSTRVCFVAQAPPTPGAVRLADAPFGGPLFRVNYKLMVGAAPQLMSPTPAAQAISQPLELKLNQPDVVFQYAISTAGKQEACKSRLGQLSCKVDQLGLKQGTVYTLMLVRRFDGQPAGVPLPVRVTLLPSTKVVADSVSAGEIVYSKPKNIELTLDKPISAAIAKLDYADGSNHTAEPLHVSVNGSKAELTWDNDLPREKTFTLTLESVMATDGTTLDVPYTVSFATSGGPKVVGINIASAGVPANTRVVVTLDQPLAPGTDIGHFASLSGGTAAITQQSDKQVVFALQNVPRCGAFTLTIAKGLVSSSGVTSDAGWSQASRMSCGLAKVIGYSVKGRPIIAYFFGSGGTTILFCGGIHGSEPSGYYMMQDWANYLDANGFKIPADKQVVVVPELNPDGIAADQRYNADDVNLDRNFPTSDWEKDIQVAGGATLVNSGGVTPASEPETRAIMALIETLHVRAEFSFHAQGSLVGANKVADSTAIGSAYAAAVGYQTVFYDPEEVFGYTLTGELETWEGEQFGMPAVLVELPTLTGHYFSRHVNELWNMVNLQ